jgi:hypothetical protein
MAECRAAGRVWGFGALTSGNKTGTIQMVGNHRSNVSGCKQRTGEYRLVRDQGVGGSNPLSPTIISLII